MMSEKMLRTLLSLGNAVTILCFSLFPSFSKDIAYLFFPPESFLQASIVYGLSLIGCPLGGLFFGYIADKKGAVKTLRLTLGFIALSTFVIGLLPSYSQIGSLSPVILLAALILQGMCVGGEYTTALSLLAEKTQYKSERNCTYKCSFIPAAGIGGWALSLTLMLMSRSSYAGPLFWRASFIIGGLWALVSLFFLKRVPTDSQTDSQQKSPFYILALHYPGSMLAVYCCGALVGALFYGQFVFSMTHLPKVFGVESSIAEACGIGGMAISGLLTPLMGHIADRFGRVRLMLFSSIATALLAIPLASLITYADNAMIILAHIFAALLMGSFLAPACVLSTQVFPKSARVTGSAFPYQLGAQTLGAMTPFVSTFLIHQTGAVTAPASFLTFCAVLGVIAAFIFSYALGENKEASDL